MQPRLWRGHGAKVEPVNTVTRAIGRIAGSRVNIRARFVLGFAVVCVILAGAVVAVLSRMGSVEAEIDRIAHLRVPTSISSARMANDINASLAALRGWMLTGESSFKAERAAIWRDIDAVSADMDRLSARWTDPDTVARWKAVKATLDAFRAAQRRVEDRAHGAGERPATTLPFIEAAPHAARLLDDLLGPRQADGSRSGGMVAGQRLLLAEETLAAEADIALLKTIVLALFSAGLATAWVIAAGILRSIVEPVRAITAAMSSLARGDTEVRVPARDRADEFGDMAESIQVFKTNAIERRQAEQRFRTLLDATPDAMVITDKDGLIMLVNEQTERMFGYRREELLGQKVERLIPARYRKPHLEHRNGYLADPRTRPMGQGGELYGLTKDGREFPVDISLSSVQTDEGTVVLAFTRDITAHKKATETIRNLTRFPDQNPGPVMRITKDGTLAYANEASAPVLKSWQSEVGQAVPEDWRHMVSEVLRTARTRTMEYQYGSRIFSLMITPYPEYSYVNVYGHDITERRRAVDELRHQSTVLDVLYRIAAIANEADVPEHAMATSVQYICIAMGWQVGHIYVPSDTSPNALVSSKLWYLEEPGRFAAFRKISENLECHRGDGLLGRVLADGEPAFVNVTREEDFLRAKAADDAGLRTGIAMPVFVGQELVAVLEFFCTRALHTDQSLLQILHNIGTLLGRVFERKRAETALTAKERALWKRVKELRDTRRQLEEKNLELGAHRDHLEEKVAERTAEVQRQAERLAQALQKEQELNTLQREFVSLVSHEFRTPLTIIDSAAQRLVRSKDKMTAEDLATRTGKIRAAVRRMTGLIESTLYASRLDAGEIRMEPRPCDLKALVREVCARQAEISKFHDIRVDVDGLPEEIHADAGLLDQVFTNLLSNAVKYAPNDPRIEVKGWTDGTFAALSVCDHGVGIPADDLPRMFERFFRARTSAGIGGTGIGLNLVKRLVEMHTGTTKVDSVEGQGSVFTVRLPIGPRAAGAPAQGTGDRATPVLGEVKSALAT